MTLSTALIWATWLTYGALALLALADFARARDAPRRDIALLFAALGLAVAQQIFTALTGQRPEWLGKLSQLSVLAQPYLLLRLVRHFRSVPRWVEAAVLVGALASAAVWLWAPAAQGLVLLTLLFFIAANLYSFGAFAAGARASRGVPRWRLGLAAAGAGLLAGTMLANVLRGLLPAAGEALALAVQACALGSGLAFYLGFAPPRRLRRAWQLSELDHYLQASAGHPAGEPAAATLQRVCAAAGAMLGARGSLAALWRDERQALVIEAATHPALAAATGGTLPSGPEGAVGRAWHTRRSSLASRPDEFSEAGRRLMAAVGAQAVLAVPLLSGQPAGSAQSAAAARPAWGLLVALLPRGALFPADDLSVLSLLAAQAARELDQAELLAEQRELVSHLHARTAQLEASNQELEAFAYSVSHDLRTPLRHIEGFGHLLRASLGAEGAALDGGPAAHVDRILEAGSRMGRLIDDLLSFSRLGRADLADLPVSLDQLVAEARAELRDECADRLVEWVVHPLPVARGDPALLRLALINLLGNALKYTRPRARAVIEIGAVAGVAGAPPGPAGETPPQHVALYVRDNGVGFDMRYAGRLFGVFQRLHHADEFEGVGIGLANVRRIVQRHGGQVWAEGAPEAGATFYLTLPISRQDTQ